MGGIFTGLSGNNPLANNVWIGDQFTPIIDLFLTIDRETGKSLANDVAIDQSIFDLASGHGALNNDIITIKEDDRCYQARILNVATDTVTVDTPLDFAFTAAGAVVTLGVKNLNLDGSSSTLIAKISPPNSSMWDITRVVIHIEDATIMDSAKFGGMPALTNGVVLRHKNHVVNNIFNVKSNGALGERAYDIQYDPKAPAGVFGFRCRRSFGGQDKNGVVIRLDGAKSDELQLLIRDSLVDLTLFRVIAQGHLTTSQGGL